MPERSANASRLRQLVLIGLFVAIVGFGLALLGLLLGKQDKPIIMTGGSFYMHTKDRLPTPTPADTIWTYPLSIAMTSVTVTWRGGSFDVDQPETVEIFFQDPMHKVTVARTQVTVQAPDYSQDPLQWEGKHFVKDIEGLIPLEYLNRHYWNTADKIRTIRVTGPAPGQPDNVREHTWDGITDGSDIPKVKIRNK